MINKKPRILFFDIEPYYVVRYDTEDGKCVITSMYGGKERILKQHINMYGYLSVKVNGVNIPIHNIIGREIFGKKKGYSINHKDCNKINNSLLNLEYITIGENVKHAVLNGLHVCSDPKRSGRYKDGRATKDRLKEYKHEWYERNKKKS